RQRFILTGRRNHLKNVRIILIKRIRLNVRQPLLKSTRRKRSQRNSAIPVQKTKTPERKQLNLIIKVRLTQLLSLYSQTDKTSFRLKQAEPPPTSPCQRPREINFEGRQHSNSPTSTVTISSATHKSCRPC